jgi:hypothetical protein
MKMSNVHERTIVTPVPIIGSLLDTLASADDKFWPHTPGQFLVKFNLPLQVGASPTEFAGTDKARGRIATSGISRLNRKAAR